MMLLPEIFERHRRVVLWCSGGKDSLTTLHLCRPWRHKLTVLYVHEPDGWPGVFENLVSCMDEWGFLKSVQLEPQLSFEDYVERFGWPVDVVPTRHDGTQVTSPFREEGDVKLASWWHCSIVRHLQPLDWCTTAMGADAVITGSRGQDAPFFAAAGSVQTDPNRAWTRYNPIQHWTTDEVYTYIDAHNIQLPHHYKYKRYHQGFEWVDCMSCTWKVEHWRILKTYYPRFFAKRWPRVKPVFAALLAANMQLAKELEELPSDAER